MASCEVTTYTPPPVNEYTLKLTQEEAEALVLVLARVAGDPYASRRGQIESISKSLRGVGSALSLTTPEGDIRGTIVFEDRG